MYVCECIEDVNLIRSITTCAGWMCAALITHKE